MRLYFTRHGESEANRLRIISNRDLPHPLTEVGYLQAVALADFLCFKPVSRVYSSPLLRARQTGEILATRLSVPLYLVDGLREPDCGELEGRNDEEAWSLHQYWFDRWISGKDAGLGPPGGESLDTIRGRFTTFITSLVENYGPSPAEFILVTHGETLLLGLPALVSNLNVDYIRKHCLGHGSLLCVEYQDGVLIYRKPLPQII